MQQWVELFLVNRICVLSIPIMLLLKSAKIDVTSLYVLFSLILYPPFSHMLIIRNGHASNLEQRHNSIEKARPCATLLLPPCCLIKDCSSFYNLHIHHHLQRLDRKHFHYELYYDPGLPLPSE